MKSVAGGVLFVLLATANGAGYRYGVSDQAFYIPAVTRILNPAAFARDAPLIDAQGTLILTDEVLAAAARATGLSLEILFFVAYLLALALIWTAIVLIGRTTYTSPWLIAALGAVVTLRHQIPRTSVNSLEPYFHPRMLAFGVGALAVAALLRRRFGISALLVGAAALLHITTALWFAVLIGVAMMVLDVRWRRAGLWIGGAAVAGVMIAALGPARASFAPMDEEWLRAVAAKESLFASQWPMWTWIANLGLLALLAVTHYRRVRGGRARAEDEALLWGAAALVALFLVTLPAVVLGLALPVQFQISRIFWLVDFLLAIYLIALVRRDRAAMALAILLVAVSATRGIYIMTVERPERALFALRLDASPWHDVMAWLRTQPLDTHVLADPGHAWRYGTSVRVSAARDVFLEDVKDSAIAIYSREVAARYLERTAAIGDFSQLDAHAARRLAAHYDLDYLVTEADLDLPVAYRNEQFRVYTLAAR